MEKKRKVILWAIVIALIFVGIIGGVIMKTNHDNRVLAEQEAESQLSQAYYRQNVALSLYTDDQYHPMDYREGTEGGVNPRRYFRFACYTKLTGNELTYEQVTEYLSKQYEEDGEVRIYNNGRHPEIEKYVEWALEHENDLQSYITHINLIYRDYALSYGVDNWATIDYVVVYRNQAILDELIKYEADPNYVMDEQIMWAGLDFGPLAESKP